MKAVTIIMADDLHEAAKVVLQDLGMSMSGYLRRRLIDLISDWSEQQQTHRYDHLINRGARIDG
jgi:hypothetical protein